MTDEQPTTTPGEDAPAPATAPAPAGARRWPRALRAILAIALGIAALLLALEAGTSSAKLCGACHEMRYRADMWARSAHLGVPCVSCHTPARPAWNLPARVADRAALLARDISKHVAGGYEDPVDTRVRGVAPIADAVCLQCHDPNRKATSGFRITIDHVAHAKRNGSCVSCHVRTAHPIESRGMALTFMSACFACHGTSAKSKAPGRCDLCHPAGYQLLPASHKAKTWSAKHGRTARTDVRQCEMCHDKAKCDACHGIEMPHPMGWSKGRPGHGDVAKRDRQVCMKCHGGTPDMCSMCHHESFKPAKGTWAQQHGDDAEKRGIDFCVSCHSPTDCVRCHMKQEQGQ